MIEEGNKHNSERNWEGNAINFWKMTLLANVFRIILESQQRPYKYQKENFAIYLDELQPITSLKDLIEMSKSLEPVEYINKFKEKEEERRRKELSEPSEPSLLNSIQE